MFESAGWRAEGVQQSWNDANLLSFSTQAWDCVLLTLSRCLLFPLVTLGTVRLGSPYGASSQQASQKAKGKLPTNSVDGKQDLYAPLVCEPCTSPLNDNQPPSSNDKEESEQAASVAAASAADDAAARGKAWRHFGIAVLFVLSTAYQLYVGLKVSAYKFGQGDEAEESDKDGSNKDTPHGGYTAEAVLLCVSVLWINLEVFALRTLVAELTRKDGLFLPDVHPHPLFVLKGVALHWYVQACVRVFRLFTEPCACTLACVLAGIMTFSSQYLRQTYTHTIFILLLTSRYCSFLMLYPSRLNQVRRVLHAHQRRRLLALQAVRLRHVHQVRCAQGRRHGWGKLPPRRQRAAHGGSD